jgi:hypothetical protein
MNTEIRDLIRRMSLANPLTWALDVKKFFRRLRASFVFRGPSSVARSDGVESNSYALTDWSAGRSEGARRRAPCDAAT